MSIGGKVLSGAKSVGKTALTTAGGITTFGVGGSIVGAVSLGNKSRNKFESMMSGMEEDLQMLLIHGMSASPMEERMSMHGVQRDDMQHRNVKQPRPLPMSMLQPSSTGKSGEMEL